MKSSERYFLIEESNGTFSIADRQIFATEKQHRLIVGMSERQGQMLVSKLNSSRQ